MKSPESGGQSTGEVCHKLERLSGPAFGQQQITGCKMTLIGPASDARRNEGLIFVYQLSSSVEIA